MPYLAGFPTPQDYGATGDGTTDDTSAINSMLAALNSQGGGVGLLPWGKYLVSSTISIPPYTRLVGQSAFSLNLNAPSSAVSRIIASASWAPSSSTGIVSFLSQTPGGWSVTAQSSGLRGIYLDGSQNSNANLNGIFFQGPVYDTHLDDVYIYAAPHNGVHAVSQAEAGITPTFPYHQRWSRVSTNLAGNTGYNIVNFTDSTFDGCLAFASVANNWALQNNSNSVLTACRAEWSSGGRGFDITGSSGAITLSGCTTDQNASEGLRIHAATGQSTSGGGIAWTGGKIHSDGNGGTNSNGIKVTGSTIPVTITGTVVEAGQKGASYYPVTAIEIDASSSVTVSASILQGVSTAWSDGGGNSFVQRRGCLAMVGNPGSQVLSQLTDIPTVSNPLPEDQNLLAWTFDPALQTANSTASAGVLYLNRIMIRQTTTITNLLLSITTIPSGLTTGANWAGLYTAAGTLLSQTVDQTTAWATTGLKTMALAAAQTVAPGMYYLGFVANASTTTPAFARSTAQGGATVNAGATTATPRYATSGTGQTTLPSSVTITSATANATAWWGAFS